MTTWEGLLLVTDDYKALHFSLNFKQLLNTVWTQASKHLNMMTLFEAALT